MLLVDLSSLKDGPVTLDSEVAVDDPLFDGLDLNIAEPVKIDGRISSAGATQVYWRGHLKARVIEDCRRCLEPVTVNTVVDVDALFTDECDTEDPSVYAMGNRVGELYLGDAVREELILAVPGYVVCREDCRGLCPTCGINLNREQCKCLPVSDPRWTELESLRDTSEQELRRAN